MNFFVLPILAFVFVFCAGFPMAKAEEIEVGLPTPNIVPISQFPAPLPFDFAHLKNRLDLCYANSPENLGHLKYSDDLVVDRPTAVMPINKLQLTSVACKSHWELLFLYNPKHYDRLLGLRFPVHRASPIRPARRPEPVRPLARPAKEASPKPSSVTVDIKPVKAPPKGDEPDSPAKPSTPKLEFEGELRLTWHNPGKDKPETLAELEFDLEQKFDSGFGWALHVESDVDSVADFRFADYDQVILFDFITPIGKLSYGGIDEEGAAELFFEDIDAMATEVEEYKDKYTSLRWRGKIGKFKYAFSSRNTENNKAEYSAGFGYSSDKLDLTLAFDIGSDDFDRAFAWSASYDFEIGKSDLKAIVSYINVDDGWSLGLASEIEFGKHLNVTPFYAINRLDDPDISNGFGVEFEYEKGDFEIEGEWVFDGERRSYEFELAYNFDDLFNTDTTLHLGYEFEENKPKKTGSYLAMQFKLAKKTILVIAVSELKKAGNLDLLRGFSVFLETEF